MGQYSRTELEALIACCDRQLAATTNAQTRDVLNCMTERYAALLDALPETDGRSPSTAALMGPGQSAQPF